MDLSASLAPWSRWLRACLAPPCCELCLNLVPAPPELCPACRLQLRPLRPERCAQCALPFPAGSTAGHRCEECLVAPPSFQRVDAAYEFQGSAAGLLHRLKFGGQLHVLPPLLRGALPSFREVLREFSPQALLPVPLGRWRRLRRGFNQSYVLAESLLRSVGESLPLLLAARRRATAPQARQGRAARLRAMREVFHISDRAAIRGRRLLVFDDVMTTGATVEALSKSLLQAGAEAVQVYVLARTARNRDG
ncbi:MAG: phosphoribosyltransferase family protein [bacterium]